METVLFYKGKHIFTQACKYLALLGLAFLFFLPIYWVFKGSLQPNADIKAWPPIWVPWPATLDNFKTACRWRGSRSTRWSSRWEPSPPTWCFARWPATRWPGSAFGAETLFSF